MSKINHIMYWSPSLVNIATNKAVFNSALSLKKFDKKEIYKCSLLNFFGEFNNVQDAASRSSINIIGYFSNRFNKFLPRHGKLKSRLSFILMFFYSMFPLISTIKKKRPDFLIIHLLTSLPLTLLILFNFKTKFILRISGLPKLNFLRKYLWKLAFKKIYCVTCPTESTRNYIKSLNIIDPNKLKLLYDPIINISEYSIKNKNFDNKKNFEKKDYYLAVGRLTRQKNFLFLCDCFKEIINDKPNVNLLIAGEGEEFKKINNFIKKNNLEKNIFLIGYKKDILKYFNHSRGLIVSSLWEDPGFVLIEAGMTRTFLLSSNCLNGPKDLIKDNFNGILFDNNNKKSFIEKFEIFSKLDKKNNRNLLINNLRTSRKFTLFYHYKSLNNILLN